MRAQQMYARVGIEAELETLADSRHATAAVLHALRDRLTPEEAAHAAAQLPLELKTLWAGGRPALDRPLKLHRQEFLERVRLEAGLTTIGQAERVTDAVFAALKEQLSEGEADDIVAQLPRDLKRLWVRA
ncbi:MAG TPA: DUF2267 domain-containing protein [Candidatus Binatia bacterium]|nr:DUF2267 domain-containing protein [Candidatus Binatia bacterium]